MKRVSYVRREIYIRGTRATREIATEIERLCATRSEKTEREKERSCTYRLRSCIEISLKLSQKTQISVGISKFTYRKIGYSTIATIRNQNKNIVKTCLYLAMDTANTVYFYGITILADFKNRGNSFCIPNVDSNAIKNAEK